MLPILPLLLILLFPGHAAARVDGRIGTGATVERRMIAALVETVRQEAEREALASSVSPRAIFAVSFSGGSIELPPAIRKSDRVRDGPRV